MGEEQRVRDVFTGSLPLDGFGLRLMGFENLLFRLDKLLICTNIH